MGNRALSYATWAYLGENDVPVLCSRKKANEWAWNKEGQQRSRIKRDRTVGWTILTRFQRYSLAPDGPPLFWKVCCFKENGKLGMAEKFLGTKELALEFHAGLVATIRDDAPLLSEGDFLELLCQPDDDEGFDGADWWKA
jgi:hypothetical protein